MSGGGQPSVKLADGVRAISFDVTGTLIRPSGLSSIYSEVLQRHGAEIGEDELDEAFHHAWLESGVRLRNGEDRFATHPRGARGFWHDLVVRVCALAEGPEPSRFATAELYDRFQKADSWTVFPDVATSLEALRARGFRLAVLSNWDVRLPAVLEAVGIGRLFECILFSEELGVAKPHPAAFHELARSLRLAPESILHVGDGSLEDFEGASGAGLSALLLDRTGETGQLRSLEDLVARLR